MKIGIIGAGKIGGTLGPLWHRAGHEVFFGSRHPEELRALVAGLGARASAGTPVEAAQAGEILLLAVPLVAVPALASSISAHTSNKVVLDACNPYPDRDGDAAAVALRHPAGSAGWVASHFPKARVVKAFNTVYFKVLQAEAHRGGNDGVGIPLAGDDPDAIAAAVQLTRDAGFTPVIVGGLEKGKLFEPGTAVYASGMKGSEVSAALGVEAATGMREGKTT